MLREDIKQYITNHRAIGFKYRAQSSLLNNFAKFAEQQKDQFVRCKTALEWAGQAPSLAQRRNRLLTVRRFAFDFIIKAPQEYRFK